MNAIQKPDELPAAHGAFPTTHWSIVVNAGAGSESQARAALETLCRQYWYPLYSFVRRHGRSHHEAEDCTQEFLSRLIASDGLARARPERGRFRTFLLTALQNFLAKDWRTAHAAKRGGGAVHVPFDSPPDAEQRFAREPADAGLTPEEAFDRAWAAGMLENVIADLRQEYVRRGQAALFATLGPLVWGDDDDRSHAEHATRLGLNTHAFTVALQRLRRRVGDRLRAAVAETVAENEDVEAELCHLVAAVIHRSSG
jgi:RNA polymerase sigma-70 factor (ECF subfamily)